MAVGASCTSCSAVLVGSLRPSASSRRGDAAEAAPQSSRERAYFDPKPAVVGNGTRRWKLPHYSQIRIRPNAYSRLRAGFERGCPLLVPGGGSLALAARPLRAGS